LPTCHSVIDFDSVPFCERDVLAASNKLKNNFTLGPDGFPPIFFKQLKHAIALPLALIYNQLMSVAYDPDTWKMAVITPVHKKGATVDSSNYRPRRVLLAKFLNVLFLVI